MNQKEEYIYNSPNIGKLLYLSNTETCRIISILGKGTYGDIYLITQNNHNYALKVLIGNQSNSYVELDILNRLSHPNIIHATNFYFLKDSSLAFKLPLADMDIKKYSKTSSSSYQNQLKLMSDLIAGLYFLHDNNILHLDIKHNNILIYDSMTHPKAILIDFSISMYNVNGIVVSRDELVTIDHRPPEILIGSSPYKYHKSVDIWSLGMVFLTLLSRGKCIFSSYEKRDVISTINKYLHPNKIDTTLNRFLIESPIKQLSINLLKSMLRFNPHERICMEQIKNHPLFRNFRFPLGLSITHSLSLKSNINPTQYHQIFDWIYKNGINYRLKVETIFLTCHLFHQMIGFIEFKWDNLLLMAIGCLTLAVKWIEIDFHLDLNQLNQLNQNLFKSSQFIEIERFIILQLNGIIYPSTLFHKVVTTKHLYYVFQHLNNISTYYKLDLSQIDNNLTDRFDKSMLFESFYSNFNLL
jgi:serine/threonine protein kinase